MTKKVLYAVALTLILAIAALSQQPSKKHRAVIHLTTPGAVAWDHMLINISFMQQAFGADNVEVEVVCLGPGLEFIEKKNSAYQERIEKAAGTGVVFAACRNSMAARHVTKDDLFPVVTTVDSGVAELIRKQEDGWGYLKAGGEVQGDDR